MVRQAENGRPGPNPSHARLEILFVHFGQMVRGPNNSKTNQEPNTDYSLNSFGLGQKLS